MPVRDPYGGLDSVQSVSCTWAPNRSRGRNGLVPVGVRTERTSMEAMQVYHLTIQENGHSRRFVYEDRDEALTRLADAIAAGLDAKLDEVVRAPALPKRLFRNEPVTTAPLTRLSADDEGLPNRTER